MWFNKGNRALKMVKMLREAGADPNGMPNDPPLTSAAYRGNASALRYLLARPKIDVDKRDIDGYTALMWAASHGHADIVDMLLEAGADPSLRNRHGETPEGKARQGIGRFEGIIERLGQSTADSPTTVGTEP